MKRQVAAIDMHDAVVESVSVAAGQPVNLLFEHLPVYLERKADEYEVWSYKACLEMSGVHYLLIEGSLDEDIYVYDASASDGERVIEWVDLLERQSVSRLVLEFAPGGRMEIHGREACLELTEPVEHFEDWVGPL